MTYSPEQAAQLHREFVRVTDGIQSLNFRGLSEAQEIQNGDVRKYLDHGVGRRLSILKKSTEKIFEVFPPDRTWPFFACRASLVNGCFREDE